MGPDHIDLNAPMAPNRSEHLIDGTDLMVAEPFCPPIVYDPLLRANSAEDAGETNNAENTRVEEVQSQIVVSPPPNSLRQATQPDTLRELLEQALPELLRAELRDLLQENMALKTQVSNLSNQVQELGATVSTLHSTVQTLASSSNNLASLLLAHSNQSRLIAERHDRQFAAQMEYTHAVFVQRVPQPTIAPDLIAPIPPIQLPDPACGDENNSSRQAN